MKLGDACQIGILSYIVPLGSPALLVDVSGRSLTWSIAPAAALIMGAALLGTKVRWQNTCQTLAASPTVAAKKHLCMPGKLTCF